MSASVQFTPLCGEEARESCCYLLEIDDCKILLDCGWECTIPDAKSPVDSLKQVANDIDCVLLTHADMEHIGMLPYAAGKLGLNCPIYATLPVYRIGKLVLYEAIASCNSRFTL
jgi:cleavage and polyadenylation specificity factor subunit 2